MVDGHTLLSLLPGASSHARLEILGGASYVVSHSFLLRSSIEQRASACSSERSWDSGRVPALWLLEALCGSFGASLVFVWHVGCEPRESRQEVCISYGLRPAPGVCLSTAAFCSRTHKLSQREKLPMRSCPHRDIHAAGKRNVLEATDLETSARKRAEVPEIREGAPSTWTRGNPKQTLLFNPTGGWRWGAEPGDNASSRDDEGIARRSARKWKPKAPQGQMPTRFRMTGFKRP